MSLLWVESFKWITSGTSGTSLEDELSKVYSDVSLDSSDQVLTSGVRTGGRGLVFANNSNTRFTTPKLQNFGSGTVTTAIIGMYVLTPSSFPVSLPNVIEMLSGGQVQCNVQINSTGGFRIERGDAFLVGTSSDILSTSTKYYLEFVIDVDDSPNGSIEIFVNNVSQYSLSSVDLQNNGGDQAGWDRVGFGWWGNGSGIEDCYVFNNSGSINNSRKGSWSIEAIKPNSAGDSTQLNVTGAVSNFQAVDDLSPSDEDTSYVAADADAETDLYNLEDLSQIPSNPSGVMITAEIRTDDADARGVRLPVKSGTTTDEGSTEIVNSEGYTTRHRIIEQDPDTASNWTISGINALQAGIKRQS